MKLILRETVMNLGVAGDLVKVKPGYARNYLLPKGMAYVATDANMRRLESERSLIEERSKRDLLEAKRRASQLKDLVLTLSVKAGPEGRLFGSVTVQDIAEKLNQGGELDFEVDRRTLVLGEPIKNVGAYEIPVRLHPDVEITVTANVESEEG